MNPHSEGASGTARPRYKWEMLALLCGTYFFHQGDRALFGVVLSGIRSELGLSDGEAGMVGSILFFLLALFLPRSREWFLPMPRQPRYSMSPA